MEEVVSMIKIGLALSGGGIKSFAQLPVIQALEKEGIVIDAVSGTSMGSVIATLFATGIPSSKVIEIALDLEKEIKEKKIMSRPSTKILPFVKDRLIGGFVDGYQLEEALDRKLQTLGVEYIKDVKIPLVINAVDVKSGRHVVFVSHPDRYKPTSNEIVISDARLSTAVRASCSFPFVISAVEYDDMVLVDGGVRQNLPLDFVKSYGVDKTIAVTMHAKGRFENVESLSALGVRVMDLMRIEADQKVLLEADVHIDIPMDEVWIFELGKGSDTMQIGERAIAEYTESIRKLIQKKSFWDIFKFKK